MIDQENSVYLALIHNNNAQRNAHIQPTLDELRATLSQRFRVARLSASFQPGIRPHNMPMALVRDLIYEALARDWERYRLLRSRFLPSEALRFLVASFRKYASGSGRDWKRNSFVELALTDKHIRAWGSFLDSDGDFLICFEDDAVFKEDSVQRVNALIDTLARRNIDSPIYVDLAGGCKLDELKISNLEIGRDPCFRFYSKPVTNTACAYLMSRSLVTIFYGTIIRRPWLRLIGADWLMNKLFILMGNDGVDCVCMHADPTIFEHGSATGEYASMFTGRP
jgi:hypothetical protein